MPIRTLLLVYLCCAAVPPGEYTLRVAFPGFGLYEKALSITTGKTLELPVRLALTAEKQEVTVKGDPGTGVSVEADNNANSLVMKGRDLDALPDDQGDLNDMLQALAGPGAGRMATSFTSMVFGREATAEEHDS
jgi:hypothetical protein